MAKKLLLLILLIISFLSPCDAQVYFKTADLFRKPDTGEKSGSLNIYQQPGVDTLISRYVLANRKLNGRLEGFRIQIYRSASRTAKEESNKERAKFMTEFPDIPSYPQFAPPAYFLVRAGDYRTKMEGTKQLLMVRKKFPNAYLVPDNINFPDQIK